LLFSVNSMQLSGKEILRAFKASATIVGPSIGLRIPGFDGYFIRPINTNNSYLDNHDVECLTTWRNRFVNAFLTEFVATEARTAHWLSEVVRVDDSRILFMIENQRSKSVGYLGIAYIDWEKSYVEADAVVKG